MAGFYDGLVGPGTGAFLVLALTAVLHLGLLTASATAKIVVFVLVANLAYEQWGA
ncbi:hypothetical protein OG289_17255 [Streptomyces sp. NBC_01235]|nr:hypothetical protein OG289_17255 [Streptomyces sp. NBC_01235]